jgi:hypothetical protein
VPHASGAVTTQLRRGLGAAPRREQQLDIRIAHRDRDLTDRAGLVGGNRQTALGVERLMRMTKATSERRPDRQRSLAIGVHDLAQLIRMHEELGRAGGVPQRPDEQPIAGWPAADETDERIGRRPPELLVISAAVQTEHTIFVQRPLGQILFLAIEKGDEIGNSPAQRALGAVHECIMSLLPRIARTVLPRAVHIVAAAAVSVVPGLVTAEHRVVRGAPISMIRLVQENRDQELEVTCRVQDDPDARVFKLRPSTPTQGSGRRWQLSMHDRETRDQWIQLALPGAVPAITRESAKLSYRNANGGRQVDLEVGPGASRLDVWVDYGLDVNIEPDLDPRVDRLNTHGPITTVACTIGAMAPD